MDHINIEGTKGPPGEGFKLSSHIDYNIDRKLLINFGDAKTDDDAMNLNTLKRNLNLCMKMSQNLPTRWDASKVIITNVGKSKVDSDVVNLGWVKYNHG